MAQPVFLNNLSSTLSVAAGATDTAIQVPTGVGARLNTVLTATAYVPLTITQATGTETSWEVVWCTAVSIGTGTGGADVLTITRAHDGTSAAVWGAGSKIESRLTAESLAKIALPIATAVPTGAPAVGQYLTLVYSSASNAYTLYVYAGTTLGWQALPSFALDGSGNIIANIVPRTDTLANLAVAGLGTGELASATDAAAIVKGTATGNQVFGITERGGYAFLTNQVTGTGSSTTALAAINAGTYQVQSVTAAGVLDIVLPAGSYIGQRVSFENAASGLSGIRVSSITYSASSPTTSGVGSGLTLEWTGSAWTPFRAYTLNQPRGTAFFGAFSIAGDTSKFSTPASAAAVYLGGTFNVTPATAPGHQICIGGTTYAGSGSLAAVGGVVHGDSCIAIGGFAYGARSVAIGNPSFAIGGNACALFGAYAAGVDSFAAPTGLTGFGSTPALALSAITLSGTTVTATFSTAGVAATFAAGDQVVLSASGYSVSASVATVNTGANQITFPVDAFVTQAMLTGASLWDASVGTSSSAFNGGSAVQLGQISWGWSNLFSYGGNPTGQVGGQASSWTGASASTAGTASAQLTLDAAGAYNTRAKAGVANAFVPESGKAYRVRCTLVGRLVGGPDCYSNIYDFTVTRANANWPAVGAISVSAVSAIGPAQTIGATFATNAPTVTLDATTIVGQVRVNAAMNAGTANINWAARFDAVEVIS